MYEVSVTVNPYVDVTGDMSNNRFFPAQAEDEYNKSGFFNAGQITEGYCKRSQKPIDTILEWGCGNLRIGRFLAKECNHYTGVDISPAVFDAARAKATEYNLSNVELIPANDFNEENYCDLCICFQVVQHNPYNEQIKIMRQIEKALKPGAWACIHLPKLENKPDYINCSTCMCFTQDQALELGSIFAKCEIEEQTLLPGWDDYYLWVQKEEA